MRIAILSEYFHPDSTGGTGTVLSNLARCLTDGDAHLRIDVITSRHLYRSEAGPLPPYEDWNGIRIFRVRSPRSNRPSTVLRLLAGLIFTGQALLKLLARGRLDLVLVVTNPPTLPVAALILRQLTRTPYLYLIHDLYPDLAVATGVLPGRSPVAGVFRGRQKRWLHAACRTIVLGRCMRDHLTATYGVPPDRIEVIPNGSDPSQVFPMSRDTRFRARHGLGGFLVLYAGNLGQYHNFDAILDAAKRLRETAPEITFALVGEGARKEHVRRRIEEEGIANVRLFPFVPPDEFTDLLASADVSLVTLEPRAEGLGVPSKFYNLLASGRPIIGLVPPGSEVARVLAEADCGFQLDPSDAAGLAEILHRLSRSPEQLRRMGENARELFLREYTLERIAARYQAVFAAVTEPHKGDRYALRGLGRDVRHG